MPAAASAKIDQQRAIAIELRRSFEYYAPRCLKIRTKSGRVEPFVMNRAQAYLHRCAEEQYAKTGRIRVLVLKGRQQGISTYIEGRFYWRSSGEFGKRVQILTHEDKATANLFGMARRYHEHCPAQVRPRTRSDNANVLAFAGFDSEYHVATAGSKNTGRSSTIQLFHGSEVAFWSNAKDHLAGLGQALPDAEGTECFLESTANGPQGEFYSLWQQAIRGHSDYIPVFIPWMWQPEYRTKPPDDWAPTGPEEEYMRLYRLDREQLYWRHRKIRDDFRGDEALFDQEYPATDEIAFRKVGGTTLIPAAGVINAMACTTAEAFGPKIIGVDPAEFGDDDSAVARRQGRKVHDVKRRHGLDPMEVVGWVASVCDEWEKEDGRPVEAINVDANGLGAGIYARLAELGYPANRILTGEKAIEDQIYVTKGDEMWCKLRDWLRDPPCTLPNDDVLRGELIGRQFGYDSNRRIRLMSKERMRADGIPSPDSADAVALTFAIPFTASRRGSRVNHRRKVNPRA